MKRLILSLIGLFVALVISCQTTIYNDLILQKTTPMLHLNGAGPLINFNGNMNLTHTVGQLSLSGGNLSLGTNSLFTTGSLSSSGSRILKGWFTNLEITNAPTINGVSIATTYAPLFNPQFTGTVILPVTTSIGTVSSTEIGYIDNVTSPVQSQISNITTSLLDDAEPLEDYSPLWTDTAPYIATKNDLLNIEGGGSGLGMYELRGIIGTTTGIPVNGDSLIINTGFITHPHVLVYRDG